MKLQWNKYIVPPHTIYSRPNKLQSQRMLPSNSLFSWKLCWNLICIQKKKKDEISKNIYSPRYVVLTHTPLHMSSLANTCRHILACPTLLKWCGGCFLLDLAQKNHRLVLWKRRVDATSAAVWRLPGSSAFSGIGGAAHSGKNTCHSVWNVCQTDLQFVWNESVQICGAWQLYGLAGRDLTYLTADRMTSRKCQQWYRNKGELMGVWASRSLFFLSLPRPLGVSSTLDWFGNMDKVLPRWKPLILKAFFSNSRGIRIRAAVCS